MGSGRTFSIPEFVTSLAIGLGVWIAFGPFLADVARGDEVSSLTHSEAAENDFDATAFRIAVRQLGAEAFFLREQAARYILEAGPRAMSELDSLYEQVPDPEVRARLTQLREQIQRDEIEHQLAMFLDGEVPAYQLDLPAWGRFSEISGNTPETRDLYARMLRKEPDLLQRIESNEPKLGFEAADRIIAITSTLHPERLPTIDRTLPLILALVCDTESHYPVQGYQISVLLSQQGEFASTVRQEPAEGPLRRLASAWVVQEETAAPYYRIMIARNLGLEAAIEPALEIINLPGKNDTNNKVSAFLTIAQYGSARHIDYLEPFLDDDTTTRTSTAQGNVKYNQKVQDVALIAMLHLTGQEPTDYDFYSGLRTASSTVYSQTSIGFSNEESRLAALKKWKQWREVNLHRFTPRFPPAIEGIGL